MTASVPEAVPVTDCRAWTEHVILCGLHGDGLRVVEQLRLTDTGVVVIDHAPDSALVPLIQDAGVPYLRGDSRLPSTLREAGLAGASALVCVESEDLHTLATALLARELRPELRIVVGLRNAAVGRALESIGVAVLDIAGLSAPSVIEACLGSTVHSLLLGGQEFLVSRTECDQDGTLRELFGDLAPVGVIGVNQDVVVTPGRDHPVRARDTVVLVGPTEQVEQAGLLPEDAPLLPAFVGARAPRPVRSRPTLLPRFLLGALDRRLKIVLIALAGLITLSVVVLSNGYRDADGSRMSVLDAIYFTIETIGTVGFGDFYFRDQPAWLRVWAIALMIIGATMATVFFALLTNMLISRTIAGALGRRRVTGLSDHVIVVGLGTIGLGVVDGLRAAGADVLVVETDEENRFLAAVRQHDTPVVVADATLPDTFAMVRLEHAKAVAVLTSNDLVNIETGLAIRDLLAERWSQVPVVLRLFDRRLASTVEASFDFRFVRSTSALAAPWFVGAALGLDVLHTFYVGHQSMLVGSLRVAPGSVLDGVTLGELDARIRVVTLTRGDGRAEPMPRRDTRLAAGDRAYLIGPDEELLTLLRRS